MLQNALGAEKFNKNFELKLKVQMHIPVIEDYILLLLCI